MSAGASPAPSVKLGNCKTWILLCCHATLQCCWAEHKADSPAQQDEQHDACAPHVHTRTILRDLQPLNDLRCNVLHSTD